MLLNKMGFQFVFVMDNFVANETSENVQQDEAFLRMLKEGNERRRKELQNLMEEISKAEEVLVDGKPAAHYNPVMNVALQVELDLLKENGENCQ